MSNITINEEESQAQNQKTTPVTESSFEPNNSSISLPGLVLQIWLGMRDSNPRMPGPEPGALPLGESPVQSTIISSRRASLKHDVVGAHELPISPKVLSSPARLRPTSYNESPQLPQIFPLQRGCFH